MRIPINLASHPYENLRPLYVAVGIGAMALVILASLVVWKDRQNRNETRLLTEQIRRMENELEELRQEQQGLEQWLRTPEVQQIRDRSAFLNSLIMRKSLSWTQIFMDLEKILPARAQITSIRPSLNQSQQAELNLSVAAAGVAPLVEFLKNLESSPRFGSPVVESQRFPSGKAGDSNIVLELSARYYPATPAADAASPKASAPRKAEDAAALADVSSTKATTPPKAGDAPALADAASPEATTPPKAEDAAALADVSSTKATTPAKAGDAAALAETASPKATAPPKAEDAAALAETASPKATAPPKAEDAPVWVDAASPEATTPPKAEDAAALDDAASEPEQEEEE